tara:strand:- start:114 stop:758 length:645 start_codon:yes stop_codon:yes gene_type:complete
MDQDIEIVNTNTRIEKVKNFFLNNKKKLLTILIIIILSLSGYFLYQDFVSGKKEEIANKYNQAVIKHDLGQKENIENILKKIIEEKDKTYSPLAFYFLLDNNLISSKEEINKYFDIIINDLGLDKENRNLTIFKKGLFNSDFANENEMLAILNPLLMSESIWKPHALYLMAEYYFSKNEKLKSKEFLEQLVSLENINSKIKLEAQKRLSADFSE